MPKAILLASTSPRRIELMGLLGIEFEIDNPNIDEKTIRHPSPRELTVLLAEAKARALQDKYPNTIIIGSDAVVAFEESILEKPHDKQHQKEMIDAQKGKRAEVYSSICVIDTSTGEKITKTKITPYKMSTPTDDEIAAYIATGSGLDKAGGYGQQDENGLFVDTTEGCYTNALGFPLCDVAEALKQMDVRIPIDVKEKVAATTGKNC